jgi:hypothetical protein
MASAMASAMKAYICKIINANSGGPRRPKVTVRPEDLVIYWPFSQTIFSAPDVLVEGVVTTSMEAALTSAGFTLYWDTHEDENVPHFFQSTLLIESRDVVIPGLP